MLQCLCNIFRRICLTLIIFSFLLISNFLFDFVVYGYVKMGHMNLTNFDKNVDLDSNISDVFIGDDSNFNISNRFIQREDDFKSDIFYRNNVQIPNRTQNENKGESLNEVADLKNVTNKKNKPNTESDLTLTVEDDVRLQFPNKSSDATAFTEIKNNECIHFDSNVELSNSESSSATFCMHSRKIPLHIGGLFDISGARGETLGMSELTAAKIAIQHVNKHNILPGYELKLLHNDTRCDPGVGMDALYDLIYRQPQLLMVIGSACSEVTKTLAEIVPYWNLILVSFASTSPALSEREKYRTFFRLAPADSSQNMPRAMFINEFGWDTVATLYEIEGDFSLAVDEMGNTFEQHNITIKISRSFRKYEDIDDNLVAIKKQDARIIIGGYSEKAARRVLCQAYHLGLFGPRYVWMIMSDYVERWWEVADDTNCTKQQLQQAAEGYFTVDSLNSLSDDDVSSFNISVGEFLDDYDAQHGPRPMSPYATSTYDTVWTIAQTLSQATMQTSSVSQTLTHAQSILHDFTYQTGETSRKLFFNIMQGLGFLGISGPISFEGPDRKGISVISQNQQGRMTRIALYEPDGEKLNFFCRSCHPIVWIGGRAPRDKIVVVSRQKKINSVAFLCVSCVSIGGLILAISFLAYNLYHRSLRYIKLSSPKLNNVAVIGCMLVYSGVIVLGYDDSLLDESYYPYLCTTRAFLFAAGFSLAFGAMFTKTYRVHQIFTRANRGLIKSKLLRDKQLLIIVGALLVVDSVVLIIWGVVDPMHKEVTNLTTEAAENDEDLLYISQLTRCYSHHIDKWTGTLYAYKGLLLVFGVYMAWETRHVKIPALNDSRYIGMNVYNVVIMSILVVAISNILPQQPTLAYAMESSFMLLSTTTTLCLLFLPKIYSIMTYKGDPVIAATGIMVDANCRRFAVDERRDQYYRAEVQNRVYKREIVELDQEIVRLERLLELPVQPYPKLTQELLHLLPESRVDPSPTLKRRWGEERDMCCSITDAGDICMGQSEDHSEDGQDGNRDPTDKPAHKPFRRRANRLSIRVATNYAYSKLCKLRPRFSVGNINFKHEYEDLKTSPTSPDGFLSPGGPLERSKSSHPLLRQEAVEDKRACGFSSGLKRDSEKSETKTLDTHISEERDFDSAQDYSSVTFHVPVLKTDHLKVPSISDVTSSMQDISTSLSTSCHNITGCEETPSSSETVNKPIKRTRKFGNTLEVPVLNDEPMMLTSNEPESPRLRRSISLIDNERMRRIRKLQADLKRIQKELKDLGELEYEVSIV